MKWNDLSVFVQTLHVVGLCRSVSVSVSVSLHRFIIHLLDVCVCVCVCVCVRVRVFMQTYDITLNYEFV